MAVAPDAVVRVDSHVSAAGLLSLELDDQILVGRHVGTVAIHPAHLSVLSGLELVGALVVSSVGEERGVDELTGEGEEGAAHVERSAQLIAHRVGI